MLLSISIWSSLVVPSVGDGSRPGGIELLAVYSVLLGLATLGLIYALGVSVGVCTISSSNRVLGVGQTLPSVWKCDTDMAVTHSVPKS